MTSGRNDHKKKYEHLQIINKLRTTGLTKQEMQTLLAVPGRDMAHVKTVNRFIESLQEQYGKNACWCEEITGKWYLEVNDIPDTIEDGELRALKTAIKMAGNKDISEPLMLLYEKLKSRFDKHAKNVSRTNREYRNTMDEIEVKPESVYVYVGPQATINVSDDVRETLADAAYKQEIVKFSYPKKDGTVKEHVVCPLGLMYGDSNAYLVSCEMWDNGEMAETPIKYILENITNLKRTGKYFTRDNAQTVQEYAKQFFGVFSDNNIQDVVWWASPKIAAAAKKYKFHPTQEITENGQDGSLIIKFRAGGMVAMAHHIFQWSGEMVPLAPQELIDTYQEMLKNCSETIKDSCNGIKKTEKTE